MKNRAKCKLCLDVLESFHENDYVQCKCGEISICGGQVSFDCGARDFNNFLRLDDENREIEVKVINKEDNTISVDPTGDQSDKIMNREEKISMLREMLKSYDNLPPQAMQSSVTHYDLYSVIALVLSILENEK